MNLEDISIVVVIVGVRGGCKTLLDTHFVREQLNRAWCINYLREQAGKKLYPRKKVNIFTNYPVTSYFRPPGAKRARKLQPLQIDIERLITWAPEYRDGIIHFDEIDQIADRQDWQSTVSKLITAGAQMFRHRNLSLFCTIQSMEWLNSRLQWQADIIIKSRDLAFTPWGKAKHLELGEISKTLWIDKSGVATGYSYEETGRYYPLLFFGKRYWGSYPTHHEFDIMDYKRRYKLNIGTKEITTAEQVEQERQNIGAIYQTIEYFQYERPGERIKSTDFAEKLAEHGCDLPGITWGKYLKRMGVPSSKTHGVAKYDFSTINLAGGIPS